VSKGRTIGGTIFGSGIQYGEQDTVMECYSVDELMEKVAKELGVDKDKIKWKWEWEEKERRGKKLDEYK